MPNGYNAWVAYRGADQSAPRHSVCIVLAVAEARSLSAKRWRRRWSDGGRTGGTIFAGLGLAGCRGFRCLFVVCEGGGQGVCGYSPVGG